MMSFVHFNWMHSFQVAVLHTPRVRVKEVGRNRCFYLGEQKGINWLQLRLWQRKLYSSITQDDAADRDIIYIPYDVRSLSHIAQWEPGLDNIIIFTRFNQSIVLCSPHNNRVSSPFYVDSLSLARSVIADVAQPQNMYSSMPDNWTEKKIKLYKKEYARFWNR